MALEISNDELLASITMLEKKVKKLSKMGPGAAMAAAANNSHLRRYQAEADSRGLELATVASPAGVSKGVRK